MCIAAVAWRLFDDLPVLVLSNRDEFFHRQSRPCYTWDNGIVAGQDVQAGGTWLGVHPYRKRWAVILNFRQITLPKPSFSTSRGHIVRDFLLSDLSPMAFARQLDKQAYDGFNLVMGDENQAVMMNNQGYAITALPQGLYVLSNGQPDAMWYKCQRLNQRMSQELLPLVASQQTWQQQAFEILKDSQQAELNQLPNTGLPQTVEQALSSIFIPVSCLDDMSAKPYGTQVSSILTIAKDTKLIEKWHHIRESV